MESAQLYASIAIDDLLTMRADAVNKQKVANRQIWDIDEAIKAKMLAEGIEDLGHPEWNVIYAEGPPTYNKDKLMAELPELVPPQEWAKAFTPAWVEHREHGPDINMTQIKPMRRFSQQVRNLIEECRTPGMWILKISEKNSETRHA